MKIRRWCFFACAIMISTIVMADIIDHSNTEMVLSNMGPLINGAGDEFYPTITADGSRMVFSIRPLNKDSSDIYMSVFKNGAWSQPRPVTELNTSFDEQTPYISPDGTTIVFSSNREGSIRPPKVSGKVYYYTNDLYISKFSDGRWSEPEPIEGDVNTEENERAPSLSRDGKILYFSRYPGNTIEKSKIYRAKLFQNKASDVELLPEPVNSGFSDFALMESNNKPGFFFSSSRPGGHGLWDIYFVSFIDGKFGSPINLGAPVNSNSNDLTITEIGRVVFFCSDRKGGRGNTDIYSVTLSPRIFRIPDTGFIFSVRDKETKAPISAKFTISVQSLSKDGKAAVHELKKDSNKAGILEIKVSGETKKIVVDAEDEQYEPFQKIYIPSAGEMKKETMFLRRFKMEEVPVEEKVQVLKFRPIYFDFASSKIPMKEMLHLWNIVRKLRNETSLCLKITGHTDSKGGESANVKLGMRRAQEIKRVLLHFGLSRFRYKLESKGESVPGDAYIVSGEHRYNRRVEFEVIDCERIDDDEDIP